MARIVELRGRADQRGCVRMYDVGAEVSGESVLGRLDRAQGPWRWRTWMGMGILTCLWEGVWCRAGILSRRIRFY